MQQVKLHFNWFEYSRSLSFSADAIAVEINKKFRFCCKDRRSWIHTDLVSEKLFSSGLSNHLQHINTLFDQFRILLVVLISYFETSKAIFFFCRCAMQLPTAPKRRSQTEVKTRRFVQTKKVAGMALTTFQERPGALTP